MYIISGAINDQPAYMTQAQIQDFEDRGHEIASHSVPYAEYNDATLAAIRGVYSTQRAYNDDGTDNSGFNSRANYNPYNLRVKFVESTTATATVQGWIDSAKASNIWLILAYHEVGENIGGGTYTTDTAVLDADMKAVKDSGLGIVTVAQGAAEVLSQTSGN